LNESVYIALERMKESSTAYRSTRRGRKPGQQRKGEEWKRQGQAFDP
jgi:hypothetical protein